MSTVLNIEVRRAREALTQVGWRVEPLPKPKSLPAEIVARYPWIPTEYRELIEGTKSATNADDKTWLLTTYDYSNISDSAYAWNEWERRSLEAAADDVQWQIRIREFWDAHFPILTSVKSGYAYLRLKLRI